MSYALFTEVYHNGGFFSKKDVYNFILAQLEQAETDYLSV